MKTYFQMQQFGAALLVTWASLGAVAWAQQPATPQRPAAAPRPAGTQPAITPRPAPRPGEVESDPIKCWWKADRTAVRVGERFNVVLTCGVIETGPVTVVPAANQLEPGAIQVTPFEVVSGGRRDDIVASPWRYMQFEYVVRLMNDGFFGQDVSLPPLTVTYTLQARGGSSQGREQGYVLPALPMRILSVVPKDAADIRDASLETFAAIEGRRFRSTAETVGAFIAFAFAGALLILALVRATSTLRARDTTAVRPLPVPSLLAGCLRALSEIRTEARGGWSPELMRRALAALRVASAVAIDRRVAQTVVDRAPDIDRDGQLTIRTGWIGRQRAVLSAPTTSKTLVATMANGNGHGRGAGKQATLQELSDALRVFSAARYGRGENTDHEALNSALDDGTRAVKRLKTGTMWHMRAANAVARTFTFS